MNQPLSEHDLEFIADRIASHQDAAMRAMLEQHPPDLTLPGAIGGSSMLVLGAMLVYFSYRLGSVADAPIRRWFSTWAVLILLAGVGGIVQALELPNPIRECGAWTCAASLMILLVMYGAGLQSSIEELVSRHKSVRDGGKIAESVQSATLRMQRIADEADRRRVTA